jgi:hypothetical protein
MKTRQKLLEELILIIFGIRIMLSTRIINKSYTFSVLATLRGRRIAPLTPQELPYGVSDDLTQEKQSSF